MNDELNCENVVNETIPSMDDFKDEIEKSFCRLREGDLIAGTVIGISDTEVTLDLGSYAEGIIKLEELSNDPRFSIKADVTIGEKLSTVVIGEDNNGSLLLSKKQAEDILAWDNLKELLKSRTIVTVKIAEAVNSGVITYLSGIRAFIPASKLALSYVEDLDAFVGKTLDAIVITVSESDSKLVLSVKDVEKDRALADKSSKISKLQKGLVTKGIVETIMPYGAFVNIGEGLSGLVHISEICGRRIKSPNEVIKEGDEVSVKIIDIKDGKVSLSMKAIEEDEDILDNVDEAPFEYSTGESVSTGLSSLLAGIKLD